MAPPENYSTSEEIRDKFAFESKVMPLPVADGFAFDGQNGLLYVRTAKVRRKDDQRGSASSTGGNEVRLFG